MHIQLFTALQAVDIPNEKAEAVVDAIEAHMSTLVQQAVQPLLQRMDTMNAELKAEFRSEFASLRSEVKTDLASVNGRLDALTQITGHLQNVLDTRTQRIRWVIGTAIAVATATVAILGRLHGL